MFENEKLSLPQNHTLSDKWDVIHRSLASERVYTKTRPLSILTIRFMQPKWWWQEHSSKGFKAQKPTADITLANPLFHLLDKLKTSAKHQHYLWNLESNFVISNTILRINLCVTHIIWQSLKKVEGVTFKSWKYFDIQILPICLCFLCRI